ncbi:MAG: hypothetical protein EXR86_02685 [Gammaproteobacteria bacterium]|nr:hypothetical protein [Gammaproteobacteria bacterium]
MNPSIELRIRTMQRAITEVILPAVDPNNSLAQEQTRLLLGHLQALALQQAYSASVQALARHDAEELAGALQHAVAGGPATRKAAEQLRHAVAQPESALGHALEQFLLASADDGAAAFIDASHKLVLTYSREQALRGRAWFKAMGFDSVPASLPEIPQLLDKWTESNATLS